MTSCSIEWKRRARLDEDGHALLREHAEEVVLREPAAAVLLRHGVAPLGAHAEQVDQLEVVVEVAWSGLGVGLGLGLGLGLGVGLGVGVGVGFEVVVEVAWLGLGLGLVLGLGVGVGFEVVAEVAVDVARAVPHPPRNLDSKSTTYPSLSVPEPPESRLELQGRSGCRGLVSSCL